MKPLQSFIILVLVLLFVALVIFLTDKATNRGADLEVLPTSIVAQSPPGERAFTPLS